MENENKKNEFFEKLKVNAINVVSITLSAVAIILSIIAISGNARHRDFRPERMNYAYENRVDSQRFVKGPNGPNNQKNTRNQGPRYTPGPKSPKSQSNNSNNTPNNTLNNSQNNYNGGPN